MRWPSRPLLFGAPFLWTSESQPWLMRAGRSLTVTTVPGLWPQAPCHSALVFQICPPNRLSCLISRHPCGFRTLTTVGFLEDGSWLHMLTTAQAPHFNVRVSSRPMFGLSTSAFVNLASWFTSPSTSYTRQADLLAAVTSSTSTPNS